MSIQEILKSTDGNHIQSVTSIAVIFFIFGIIFTSIHGGRGAPLPPPEELLTTSTVPLENLSLAPGDFIILADSTPVPIESAHVSMNVPCQVPATAAAEGSSISTSTTANATQGPPSTDIKIMAGVEPDLKPAIPEYIAGLSRPENGKCTYHVQIPEVTGEPITGIAIVNTGNQTINFSSGNFATISTSTGGPLT
jgi:hypothetical protein